jgi:glutamine synthetase
VLDLEELRGLVDAGEIETVVVGFTDHYGRLCGKRFDAGFFLSSVATEGTHACDYLLTVDMEMEPVPGYGFASWDLGYGDVHLVADLNTLRRAAWLDRTALVLCDVESAVVAPRSILRAQVDALASVGLTAASATELEYYLSPGGEFIQDYQLQLDVRGEPFHVAVRRHLNQSGVPVESSKGEWGVGQHELNVRYAGLLEMADRHVVLKQCLKESALLQRFDVNFMAKPAADQAGSSCHIHISLWRDDVALFADGTDEMRWFVGGLLEHLADVTVLLAPTVNSYKRFVEGSWAPTRLAWSHDNRTAGLRIVGHGDATRVECRIAGADCNPYLALAAVVACGLDGLQRRTDPGPPFSGDVYAAADLPRVPETLRDATDLFEASPFAKEAFGAEVVEHYTHFFRTEQAAFDRAVTDWERHRYGSRI